VIIPTSIVIYELNGAELIDALILVGLSPPTQDLGEIYNQSINILVSVNV